MLLIVRMKMGASPEEKAENKAIDEVIEYVNKGKSGKEIEKELSNQNVRYKIKDKTSDK